MSNPRPTHEDMEVDSEEIISTEELAQEDEGIDGFEISENDEVYTKNCTQFENK